MSEKAKIRAVAASMLLVILAAGATASYLIVGKLSGQFFFASVSFGVFYFGFMLVFPEAFARQRPQERQLEWSRNRSGRTIIVAVIFGAALLSLVALFLTSYLNGYRPM